MNILAIILQEIKNMESTKLFKMSSEPISLLMPVVILSSMAGILALTILWFEHKKKNQQSKN